MKGKLFRAPLGLLAALLLASVCYGQAITPTVVAVGSSGIFNTMAVAAVTPDPITGAAAPCGTHVWTQAGGTTTVAGIDGRSTSIPAEPGKIWVAWDNSTSPTVVCAFLTVDSIVGDRLFLGQHQSAVNGGETNGTLLLNPGSAGGSCQVPLLQDDGANCSSNPIVAGNALPTAIQQSLNGAAFNVAFSDIRAEDAVFANGRAQCTPANSALTCLGYGPTPIGTPFESSYTTTSGAATTAQVIAYQISGFTDPISEYVVPHTVTTNVGAEPVTFFVNISDTKDPGGFGNLYASGGNTQSHTLALVFSGLLGLTTDVSGSTSVTGQPMRVLLREATSGTYNTFEWQIPRAKGTDFGQESGLAFNLGAKGDCSNLTTQSASASGYSSSGVGAWNLTGANSYDLPASVNEGCVDPLYVAGPNGSSRTRGIGTGEVVKAGNTNDPNVPNAIGYGFWSFSNFSGKTNLKYLTVDGVDPLGPTGGYTGVYPTCSGFANTGTLSCAALSFANIKNGGYRNWNIMRAITYCSPSTTPSCSGSSLPVDFLSPNAVATLIKAAQDQAEVNVADIVPYQFCGNNTCSTETLNLPVFRSHYFVSGSNEANGTHGETEAGGDMLGAIFNVQSDVDYFNNTGTEIFEFLQ